MEFQVLCERGDLDGVIAAVGRGVDINSDNFTRHTGLMSAVCRGQNMVVEWLLQQPAIEVNRQCQWGSTAVFLAVAWNEPALLSLLLAHPTADPTIRDNQGKSPLELSRWGTGRQGEICSDLYRDEGFAECERMLLEDERRRQGGGQGGGRAAGVGIKAIVKYLHFCTIKNPSHGKAIP